jgi:hypothetical protein
VGQRVPRRIVALSLRRKVYRSDNGLPDGWKWKSTSATRAGARSRSRSRIPTALANSSGARCPARRQGKAGCILLLDNRARSPSSCGREGDCAAHRKRADGRSLGSNPGRQTVGRSDPIYTVGNAAQNAFEKHNPACSCPERTVVDRRCQRAYTRRGSNPGRVQLKRWLRGVSSRTPRSFDSKPQSPRSGDAAKSARQRTRRSQTQHRQPRPTRTPSSCARTHEGR